MKKIVLLFPAILFLSWKAAGQCETFTAYHTRGIVLVLKGGVSEPLKKETRIDAGSILRIGQGSSVILLSGKDRALRLTEPATLTFSDLSALCRNNQSSLTAEYMKYVARAIIDKEESQTAMVIKGAVYRTRADYANSLMRLPADSTVIPAGPIQFVWQRPPGGEPVYLMVFENGTKRIWSSQVTDTTLTLREDLFQPGIIYFWMVTGSEIPGDSEPRSTFVLGPPQWRQEVLDNWSKMMEELESDLDDIRRKLDTKKDFE